jgi:hypothetical protein
MNSALRAVIPALTGGWPHCRQRNLRAARHSGICGSLSVRPKAPTRQAGVPFLAVAELGRGRWGEAAGLGYPELTVHCRRPPQPRSPPGLFVSGRRRGVRALFCACQTSRLT